MRPGRGRQAATYPRWPTRHGAGYIRPLQVPGRAEVGARAVTEPLAEAGQFRVGEEVDDLAPGHLTLAATPELGPEQLRVMLEEGLAHARLAEQEGLELLGEHFERP